MREEYTVYHATVTLGDIQESILKPDSFLVLDAYTGYKTKQVHVAMAIQISTDMLLMTWIYSTSVAPTRDRSTEDFSLLNVLHSDPTSITLGGRKGRRRREEGGGGERKREEREGEREN